MILPVDIQLSLTVHGSFKEVLWPLRGQLELYELILVPLVRFDFCAP